MLLLFVLKETLTKFTFDIWAKIMQLAWLTILIWLIKRCFIIFLLYIQKVCEKNYYQRNRDVILKRAKDYYENDKEKLKKQVRDKCRNLSGEGKKQKERTGKKQIS